MSRANRGIRPGTDADVNPLCEFLNACARAPGSFALVSGRHRRPPAPRRRRPPARLVRRGRRRCDCRLCAPLGPRPGRDQNSYARTHPDARGRGIGSRLLSSAIAVRPSRTWRASYDDDVGCGRIAPRAARGPRVADRSPLLRDDGDRCGLGLRAGDSLARRRRARPALTRPDLAGALGLEGGVRRALGRQVESEAEFWTERRDAKIRSVPISSPSWLLALARGEVVGFCLYWLQCERWRVGRPGRRDRCRPSAARGRAWPGFALLHDGFRELMGRGATRIVLDVDAESDQRAPALPERRRPTPRPTFTIWEKRPAPHVLH